MCGRYVAPEQAEAERHLAVSLPQWSFHGSYNIAPTQAVPVVRQSGNQREGLMMRWGLVPSFCKGVPPPYSTFNAPVEKLDKAACWRGPWEAGQRCILPAVGFYAWQELAESRTRQPYFIHTTDQDMFGFAGLWDATVFKDGTRAHSCAILTLPASALLAAIDNVPGNQRMPAILAAEDLETWLRGSAEQARALLRPYPDDRLTAYAVSARINSLESNDAGLIAQIGRLGRAVESR